MRAATNQNTFILNPPCYVGVRTQGFKGNAMTLTEQLKEVVDNYFCQYPHLSINSLALKSGVGATTLRRIVNASIKGDPAPHTVLNIVSAISNEKRLSVLIQKFDGPMGEMLESVFGPFIEKEINHTYDADLNEKLCDGINYFIYKLAANREGTTRFEIGELYGRTGLERLDDLIECGLIIEENDKIHASEKNFSLDVHVAAKHLPELVRFYKPDEIEEGKNLFYSMSESLNEEGIQKIKDIQKEAIKKIYDVMQSPFYEGKIPFFTLDMSDTLKRKKTMGVLQ